MLAIASPVANCAEQQRADHRALHFSEDTPDPRLFRPRPAVFSAPSDSSSTRKAMTKLARAEERRRQRGKVLAKTGQHPGNRGPQHEAEPECRADQPHVLGAILFRGHVGDIGHRRGNVGAEDAGQGCAPGNGEPEIVREIEQRVGQRRPGNAHEQDGAAAKAVAEPAPERREQGTASPNRRPRASRPRRRRPRIRAPGRG